MSNTPKRSIGPRNTGKKRDMLVRMRQPGSLLAPDGRTLHADMETLRRQFVLHASSLHKKRLTKNERVHWQTRGRQELLRRVSHHLRQLGTKHPTDYMLSLALRDYLGCLEKYEIDAAEEMRMPVVKEEWPVKRWKAEGQARELPGIFADLTHLLYEHRFATPRAEQHILSLDGRHLVCSRMEKA